MLNIQQQLKGLLVIEEKSIQVEEYTFMEHIQIIQALFTFAISYLEEKCKRWGEAINVLTAFCCLQKTRRSRRPKSFALDIRLKQDIKQLSVLNPSDFSDFITMKYKAT